VSVCVSESLSETTTFQLLSQEEVEAHGLHAVALGNDDAAAAATILQCSHGPDGQIFIPGQTDTSSHHVSYWPVCECVCDSSVLCSVMTV